jgi:hypothetical protein
MFADVLALHQIRQSLFVGGDDSGQFEGYTDSNGNYFDGGMGGFDIMMGPDQ